VPLLALLIPVAAALEVSRPLIAAIYEPPVIAWVLLSCAPRSRRVEMRASIDVRCDVQAAFELVSNPRNWRLYAPELEVLEPVETPVRAGTLVRARLHYSGRVMEADEIVTVFEPPRRFGTAIPASPHVTTGGYEIVPSGGGTSITYTFRGSLTPLQSFFGGWLLRGRLDRRMKERREIALAEIKRLLEAEPAAPV